MQVTGDRSAASDAVDWNRDNRGSVCKNPLRTDASKKLRMLVEEQVDGAGRARLNVPVSKT